MLHPTDGRRSLAPKTVLEVHLIIRGALSDAVRRGLVPRNVALIAAAPRLRSIPKVEQKAWTAEQLQAFLRCAAGHRLFPALWLAAMTGVRRSELLGLRWDDVDLRAATISVNRGLVAVAYEVHESRGKTRNSRRCIDLDPTTVTILEAWRGWQVAERNAVGVEDAGWLFTDPDGRPVHPHAISQSFERIVARAGVPSIRLHDLRGTHATLLIKGGVPAKVVSERLGHATPAFTIDAYQHVMPGMQADAARNFAKLIAPATSTGPVRGKPREKNV
jgi:integrase